MILPLAVLLTQALVWADDLPPLAPAEVDQSTQSLTIDNWNPGSTRRAPPPPPLAPATPVPSRRRSAPKTHSHPKTPPTKAVVAPAAAAPEAPAPRVSMNEMRGEISSIDPDSQSLRLSVEGGFTPQFDYNATTVVESNGRALKVSDLETGDHVIVRYVGKDLTAREIERLPRHAK